MEKTYKCIAMDPEFAECEFTATGQEELVLEQAKEHLISMHDFEEEDMTPEMEDKITAVMTEDDGTIPPEESEQI